MVNWKPTICRHITLKTLNHNNSYKAKVQSFTIDKPQIKLNPLEKTAIKVPTEKIAKELMRIFEIGGLNWRNGKVPDGIGFWKTYKEDSCVGFEEDKILYSSKGWI